MSHRNYEREKQIIELRLNKHMPLKAIGEQFNISEERTRQIVARYAEENHVSLLPFESYKQYKAHPCRTCGKEIYQNKYCSLKCFFVKRHADTFVSYNCEICGKLCSQKQSNYNKYKHHFCSHKCSGSFIGKEFGFVKMPHNIKANMIKRGAKL